MPALDYADVTRRVQLRARRMAARAERASEREAGTVLDPKHYLRSWPSWSPPRQQLLGT